MEKIEKGNKNLLKEEPKKRVPVQSLAEFVNISRNWQSVFL
jgi:hypothetical protein